jgi:hypothetical protein
VCIHMNMFWVRVYILYWSEFDCSSRNMDISGSNKICMRTLKEYSGFCKCLLPRNLRIYMVIFYRCVCVCTCFGRVYILYWSEFDCNPRNMDISGSNKICMRILKEWSGFYGCLLPRKHRICMVTFYRCVCICTCFGRV